MDRIKMNLCDVQQLTVLPFASILKATNGIEAFFSISPSLAVRRSAKVVLDLPKSFPTSPPSQLSS
jgi:hypothetical protein